MQALTFLMHTTMGTRAAQGLVQLIEHDVAPIRDTLPIRRELPGSLENPMR